MPTVSVRPVSSSGSIFPRRSAESGAMDHSRASKRRPARLTHATSRSTLARCMRSATRRARAKAKRLTCSAMVRATSEESRCATVGSSATQVALRGCLVSTPASPKTSGASSTAASVPTGCAGLCSDTPTAPDSMR